MPKFSLLGRTIDTDQITARQKLAGGLVISLAVLGITAYNQKPNYDSYQDTKAKNAQLESEVEEKKQKELRRHKVEDEMAQIRSELQTIQRKIPSDDNLVNLLVDIVKFAHGTNNEIKAFTPGQRTAYSLAAPAPASDKGGGAGITTAEQNLRRLPVKLTVEGTYPDLIRMFQNIEKYERTLEVTSLALHPSSTSTEGKQLPLTAELNLHAFVMPRAGSPGGP